MSNEQQILEQFLNLPLGSTEGVFAFFKDLPGAISHFEKGGGSFVYLPGTRRDRVLLVAHADTVWDASYLGCKCKHHSVLFDNGFYRNTNADCGIGADDRAGCAMLYLLKDTGHSLLITDGEEVGQIAAHLLRERFPALFDELNAHTYMIQLDRRNATDYKCYQLPVTEEFVAYIASASGYQDAGKGSRTDIVTLCRDICGVNFSIGYYDEHTPKERLSFAEWQATIRMVRALLNPPQKRYPLAPH